MLWCTSRYVAKLTQSHWAVWSNVYMVNLEIKARKRPHTSPQHQRSIVLDTRALSNQATEERLDQDEDVEWMIISPEISALRLTRISGQWKSILRVHQARVYVSDTETSMFVSINNRGERRKMSEMPPWSVLEESRARQVWRVHRKG